MVTEFDQVALGRLRRALVKQALRQLKDEHEAEDVAQDALVALCTTTTRFNDVDHVTAYARRTVHNLCVDRIRRRIRYVELEQAEHSYDTLEQEVISRDELAAVMTALTQINPAYAQVLIASTHVGRDHPAIAAATGVSLRQVRHGLDRGSKALKAKLAAAGHSLGITLFPQPLQAVFTSFGHAGRSKAKGAVVAGTALALPSVLLLLPTLAVPTPTAPTRPTTSQGLVPPIDSRTSDLVPSVQTRMHSLTALSDAALNRALDSQYRADANRLRGHEADVGPSDCLNVDGHGACRSNGGDPHRMSYTIGGSGAGSGLSPIGPVQFWQDNLPPCDSAASNDIVTCEHQYPDWEPPLTP